MNPTEPKSAAAEAPAKTFGLVEVVEASAYAFVEFNKAMGVFHVALKELEAQVVVLNTTVLRQRVMIAELKLEIATVKTLLGSGTASLQ